MHISIYYIVFILTILSYFCTCNNVESYLQVSDGKYLYIQEWATCALKQPAGVILFLHDLGECIAMYEDLFSCFTRTGLAVIGFDLRGHGITWRGGGLPCRVIFESETDKSEDTRDGLRCKPRKLPHVFGSMNQGKDDLHPVQTRHAISQFCSTANPNITTAAKKIILNSSQQGTKCDFEGLATVRQDIDHVIHYLLCRTGETSPIILMGHGVGALMALNYLDQGSLREWLTTSIVSSPSFEIGSFNQLKVALNPSVLPPISLDRPKDAQPEYSSYSFKTSCVTVKCGLELLETQNHMLNPLYHRLNITVPTLIVHGNEDNISSHNKTIEFVNIQDSKMISFHILNGGHLLYKSKETRSKYIDFLVKHLNRSRV